jgi:hypothetical protein
MSSPFSGKEIYEARFTNEAHDTIEVIYNDAPEGSEPQYISVYIPGNDPDNYDVKNLFAQDYSYERIQKETIVHNARRLAAYRNMVNADAAAEIKKVKDEYQKKYDDFVASENKKYEDYAGSQAAISPTSIIGAVFENNTNEELLFRTKLSLFESADLKPLLTSEKKQKIRKSKTLIELITIIDEIKQTG